MGGRNASGWADDRVSLNRFAFNFCLFFLSSVYLDDSHNSQGSLSGEGELQSLLYVWERDKFIGETGLI